jgi:hypothetical protein
MDMLSSRCKFKGYELRNGTQWAERQIEKRNLAHGPEPLGI